MNVLDHNAHNLNQQSAALLRAARIPFDPNHELASLALIRYALAKNLLETSPALQEPDLLLEKLAAHPDQAMALMTESEPGVEFPLTLEPSLPEAAAQLLEEILASLKALPLQ